MTVEVEDVPDGLIARLRGEQPGLAALDPVRVKSEYVQATLRRTIEQGSDRTDRIGTATVQIT